jgi:hypothetical protein
MWFIFYRRIWMLYSQKDPVSGCRQGGFEIWRRRQCTCPLSSSTAVPDSAGPEQPPAEQKEQQQDMTQKYKPLLDWLKAEADGVVRDGTLLILDLRFTLQSHVSSRYFKPTRHQSLRCGCGCLWVYRKR